MRALAVMLLLIGCGPPAGGGVVTCALEESGGCPAGCGGPFRGRQVVAAAQCLAGEVPLFCTTQQAFSEAVGCIRDAEGNLYWTSGLPSELPPPLRLCTDEEREAVSALPRCTR